MSVYENIMQIRKSIENRAMQNNRAAEDICLVAVSKTHTAPEVREAYDCGVRDFGENKVQEMLEKHAQLPEDIRWHMIGHLQRNKVRQIVPFVSMIHSVDSIRLCAEIDKEAAKLSRVIPILLEVNISGEDTKYGLSKEDLPSILQAAASFPSIHVEGLMTVAPFTEDTAQIRLVFSDLRELFLDIKSQKLDNVAMNYLSMGMSHDYEIAIDEGATHVRIGSSIFGIRNYT